MSDRLTPEEVEKLPTCNHREDQKDEWGCMACFAENGAGVFVARIRALEAERDALADWLARVTDTPANGLLAVVRAELEKEQSDG